MILSRAVKYNTHRILYSPPRAAFSLTIENLIIFRFHICPFTIVIRFGYGLAKCAKCNAPRQKTPAGVHHLNILYSHPESFGSPGMAFLIVPLIKL